MLKKIDIYNYDKKIAAYQKKIANSDMSSKNKEIIGDYTEHLFMRGLSKPRVLKYLEILYAISKDIEKDFNKINEKDVRSFLSKINQKDYSPWTKQIYRVVIKRLMMWQNNGKLPECVAWVKVHIGKSERKLPGDGELLTEEEIDKILAGCSNIRDRCLISVLYESGCRIGEVASLRISNIKFDDYGVVIVVIGKTGARKIRLVKSTQLLKALIEVHPFKDDPTNALWINMGTRNHKKPMMYGAIRKQIQRICKSVGIKKRCNPHMFRHSRATQLASHLTEFQMNQYFGWTQGSDMPSTYVHMNGRDVDSAILTMNGIAQETKEDLKNKSIRCPRCEIINAPLTKYCSRCNQILDIGAAANHEKEENNKNVINMILNELIKEPSIKDHILKRVGELGLSESVLGL